MKKLSLKRLDLSIRDLLQREQLKSIVGGYDGFYCAGVFEVCDRMYPNRYDMFLIGVIGTMAVSLN